jgi:hypothetical protein
LANSEYVTLTFGITFLPANQSMFFSDFGDFSPSCQLKLEFREDHTVSYHFHNFHFEAATLELPIYFNQELRCSFVAQSYLGKLTKPHLIVFYGS